MLNLLDNPKYARLSDQSQHRVGVSIGVVLYPDDAQDLEGLMERADAAMYAAKARGE